MKATPTYEWIQADTERLKENHAGRKVSFAAQDPMEVDEGKCATACEKAHNPDNTSAAASSFDKAPDPAESSKGKGTMNKKAAAAAAKQKGVGADPLTDALRQLRLGNEWQD